MNEPLLSLEDVHASYDQSHILKGVTMSVEEGEVVSLLGRNGVGKTTTLKSIVGVLLPHDGRITFNGEEVTTLPDHVRTKRGISYVPEDRQVFPGLTVTENLRMGAIGTEENVLTIEEVFELFPRLDERRSNRGLQLSGGEQQMLSIARALLGRTDILLLDEPTEGLAPQIISDVLEAIKEIRDRGVTVLLVAQNLAAARQVASRHYVLHQGQIVFEGDSDALDAADDVREQYLGVSMQAEH